MATVLFNVKNAWKDAAGRPRLGARGKYDLAHDDTAAIQHWIDAAVAAAVDPAHRAIVYFPPGAYIVKRTLVIGPYAGAITLLGTGNLFGRAQSFLSKVLSGSNPEVFAPLTLIVLGASIPMPLLTCLASPGLTIQDMMLVGAHITPGGSWDSAQATALVEVGRLRTADSASLALRRVGLQSGPSLHPAHHQTIGILVNDRAVLGDPVIPPWYRPSAKQIVLEQTGGSYLDHVVDVRAAGWSVYSTVMNCSNCNGVFRMGWGSTLTLDTCNFDGCGGAEGGKACFEFRDRSEVGRGFGSVSHITAARIEGNCDRFVACGRDARAVVAGMLELTSSRNQSPFLVRGGSLTIAGGSFNTFKAKGHGALALIETDSSESFVICRGCKLDASKADLGSAWSSIQDVLIEGTPKAYAIERCVDNNDQGIPERRVPEDW